MAPISLYCAAVIWKKVPFPMGLPRWLSGKEFTWQCRRHRRHGFDPWVKKIPWSRKWQPTTVFLPGRFHGQRSLVGYSPWFHKESDTTEQLSTQAHETQQLSLSHEVSTVLEWTRMRTRLNEDWQSTRPEVWIKAKQLLFKLWQCWGYFAQSKTHSPSHFS